VACELERAAAAALAAHRRRDSRARAVKIDGWVALNAYVPPKERRGLVLIDPPYEEKREFARMTDALAAAQRKWATGIFLLWYPIKERSGPDRLAAALRRGAAGRPPPRGPPAGGGGAPPAGRAPGAAAGYGGAAPRAR